MQNALWICAVLSFYSKEFSRISGTLTFPKMLPAVVAWALLTYRIAVFKSEAFIYIDTVSVAVTFIVFAFAIWRLSKIAAVFFVIHGFFQGLWTLQWLAPWTSARIAMLVIFPLWRIALLFIWAKLISGMLHKAESASADVVTGTESRAPSSSTKIIKNPGLSIVLSVLLTIALRLAVERHWYLLNDFWTAWEVTIVGTLLVLLAGAWFHLFRKYYQTIYGVFEIMVGIATTGSQIAKAQKDNYLPSWIAVGVSAFLIVRGLSNIDDGRKQKLTKLNSESPVIETIPGVPG